MHHLGIDPVSFYCIFVIVSSVLTQQFGARLVERVLIEWSKIRDDLLMNVRVKYLSAGGSSLSERWLQCLSTVLELDPKAYFQTKIL